LRVAQAPGDTRKIGKLMYYKSGRVTLRYADGTTADVTVGADCKSFQQLVCVSANPAGLGDKAGRKGRSEDDGDEEEGEEDSNKCEEFNAAIRSRLVCIPSLSSLLPNRTAAPLVKKQERL
jgi:hypothetical protein